MHISLTEVDVSHSTPRGTLSVLESVSITATEHRIGVIGANGSGKSTFLRLLNGLLTPTRGVVRLDGLDTRRQARAIRQRTGFLFTNPDSQIIMPTVVEDVGFGLRKNTLSPDEVTARVDGLLDRFGLNDHRDHPAHLLSGGQKQLLALAAVLITEPALVIADEPTTLLDRRNAAIIRDVLSGLDEQLVLATHQLELLADFDRVLCFHERHLVADGSPEEVIRHYCSLIDAGR